MNADHVVLRCDRVVNDHKGGSMISVNHSMQPSNTNKFVANGIECVCYNSVFWYCQVTNSCCVQVTLCTKTTVNLFHD